MSRPTIPDGLRALYEHRRRITDSNGNTSPIVTADEVRNWTTRVAGSSLNPRGGRTICRLVDEAGFNVVIAEANCSDHDNYNKAIGRDIALGRALKRLRALP